MSTGVDSAALRTGPRDGVRPGTAADAVDGVIPAEVAHPSTVDEVGQLLREAAASGSTVVPRGAGTKLGWGNPPTSVDLALDVRRLDDVLEHNPGDLIVRAQAGLPLAALQDRLAATGQLLALDPPEEGATVGGVVAANASGPRRLRYGTVRDLLIGVTVTLADGTLAHAGGKVVKNVAGYDLGKVFTGSFGTLGVLVETIFRLHPLPAARRVVSIPFDRPERGGEIVQQVLHSALVPTAVEVDGAGADVPHTLTVLFEGIEPAVEAQAGQAARLQPDATVGDELPESFGRPPYSADEVGLKLSYLPAAFPQVLLALAGGKRDLGLTHAVRGHAATGVLYVSWPVSDQVGPGLDRLRAELAPFDASVVVVQAPSYIKAGRDVWGPVGDALPLMGRVKERFDPDRRLSPGRFVGGI